jgi:hypothetical protein
MNRVAVCVVAILMAGSAVAQVGTAVKEGAKATGQTAKQVGDDVKGAVSSEPNKSIDKTKAKIHKAKAHHDAHVAKEAAKDAVK